MPLYTNSLSILVNELNKFPGIGKKSAERLAFYLLKCSKQETNILIQAISDLKKKTRFCKECYYLSEKEICYICNDLNRNEKIICVVESFKDVISIEKTLDYKGKYHVLMGHISPIDGIGANELTIKDLLKRINEQDVKEIILATNPNSEGDTTAFYIADQLKNTKIKLTRIARGLPIGTDLEFADTLTLAKSISTRENFF